MMYSAFDAGNYFVIPGLPTEALGADTFLAFQNGHDVRGSLGFGADDFLVAIVGSRFSYSGMWIERALILKALAPLLQQFLSVNMHSRLKIGILSDNSSTAYETSIEVVMFISFISFCSVYIFNVDHPANTLENLCVALPGYLLKLHK